MRPAALSLHRPLPSARARIVAFPHAGGGASGFRGLRDALAPHGVELCPLQPPGRENRISAAMPARIEALAAECAEAVDHLPPLPTAFLGHSLGGLVAFLSAELTASVGAGPEHLIVSGSLAPQLRGPAPVRETADPLAGILALGGVPQPIADDPELLALFEPVIRADLALADAYAHRPGPPLALPITVYSGDDDPAAPPAAAAAWRALTREALGTRVFPGGHFFLYRDETVPAALIADLGW